MRATVCSSTVLGLASMQRAHRFSFFLPKRDGGIFIALICYKMAHLVALSRPSPRLPFVPRLHR